MAGALALTVGAAPSPLSVKDAKLLDAKGREVYLNGVSFGNLFVLEPYIWKASGHSFGNTYSIRRSICILCGSKYAADFWERWQDSWITEDDVRMVREMGFNAVRLPFLAETLMYAEEPGITWREDGFKRVKRIVGWCRDAGIYVVLDMHGAPGGHTGTGIEASYDNSLRLFTDRDYWEKGVALWRELARRYKDEPTIAMYDLLNEPLSTGGGHKGQKEELVPKLAEFYRDCIAAIRAEGARQPISIEGEKWSTSTAIFDRSFDPAMVAHFHRYTFQPDSNTFADWEKVRERLKCPLILGEYGENTYQWDRDTAAFARERGVHLLFWCWKKVAGKNPSPLMVPMPEGWEKVQAYLKGDGPKPTYAEAQQIFERLLENIRAKNCIRDDKVADAVIRGKVEAQEPSRD